MRAPSDGGQHGTGIPPEPGGKHPAIQAQIIHYGAAGGRCRTSSVCESPAATAMHDCADFSHAGVQNARSGQGFCALTASSGARAYYDELRRRGQGHHAALRQLSSRLVGILHSCPKTRA